jgi:predicted N-acetyltransferase YhbS
MQNFTIQTVHTLPEFLSEKIAQYKKEAFQTTRLPRTPQQQAEHEEKYDNQHDRLLFLLAMQEEDVIGGLTLFKRSIPFKNKKIILGGVGGVWTRRDKQKMGVASAVIREAFHVLKQNNCEIVFLNTELDKLGDFYKKFGFHILPREYTFLGKSEKRYIETDGMIANISNESLFKEILDSSEPFDIGRGNI